MRRFEWLAHSAIGCVSWWPPAGGCLLFWLTVLWALRVTHYLYERCELTAAEKGALVFLLQTWNETARSVWGERLPPGGGDAAAKDKHFGEMPLWWIDNGALLGSERNGKLLPHDADVDVNYMIAQLEFWVKVVQRIKERDPRISGNTMQLELQVAESGSSVRLDLQRWERSPHEPAGAPPVLRRFLRAQERGKFGSRLFLSTKFAESHLRRPLPLCELEDMQLPCPHDARALLESPARYGSGAVDNPLTFKASCWFG
jgi:hypothetical protein